MSQGQEKTEKPTPKRLKNARQKGNVAKSQDLSSATVLAGSIMLLSWVGPYTLSNLFAYAKHLFSNLSTEPLTQTAFIGILSNILTTMILLVLPFFLGSMTIGILINLVQVKPLFTSYPLKPKLTKLNPINGFKRFWSMRSLVEFAKSIFKMLVVAVTAYIIVTSHMEELMILHSMDVYSVWSFILGIVGELGTWTCVILFVLGLADFGYQKYEHKRKLKMSKQEVKEERKQQEVDPHIKSRIRSMGIQFARKRMLAAVPTADVVVTNPTHFAVALQYDPDMAPAPRVIAKGQDKFALKIKEVAKEHNVPIVENKPLARALHKAVEVDSMIPPELFVAVAEVLAYVFSKNKGRKLSTNPITSGRPTE